MYFLDGDSKIEFLQRDGTTGQATQILVGPKVRLAFAVSPDDQRIAVSELDYSAFQLGPNAGSQAGVGLRMFVQDLSGGNRVDIFSSTTVVEWPVGWHGGHLVVAVGNVYPPQNPPQNPYSASEYHLVDPQTGSRLSTLGQQANCVFGPLVLAGTGCIANYGSPQQQYGVQGWDGVYRAFGPSVQSPDYAMALSPDGARIAGEGLGGNPGPILVVTSNSVKQMRDGRPIGWIDNSHLLLQGSFDPATYFVLDVDRGNSVTAPGGDFYSALPGNLG